MVKKENTGIKVVSGIVATAVIAGCLGYGFAPTQINNDVVVDGISYGAGDVSTLLNTLDIAKDAIDGANVMIGEANTRASETGTYLLVNGVRVTVEDYNAITAEVPTAVAGEGSVFEDVQEELDVIDLAKEYLASDKSDVISEDLYDYLVANVESNIFDEDDFEYTVKEVDHDDMISVVDREDGDFDVRLKLRVSYDYIDAGEDRADRDYVYADVEIKDKEVENVTFSL